MFPLNVALRGGRWRPWETLADTLVCGGGPADVRRLVGRSIGLSLFAIRPHGRPVRLQRYARKYEDDAMSTLLVLNNELRRQRTAQ